MLLAITRWIEGRGTGLRCSILLVDPVLRCVRPAAAPSLPPEYTEAIDGLAIGPDAGSCGAAAHRGERVIVDDIETHPYWARYRYLALRHGLRACWSSPIFSPEQEVLGTFAIYYEETRKPRDEELTWVDEATHLASIAIRHERSRRALEESELRCRERIKELTLLHQVARLLQTGPELDRALLEQLTAAFPAAWQFPDICAARLTWGELEVCTPNWIDTPWRLQADIEGSGASGRIEVAYVQFPPVVGDPFAVEERDLIRSVADMLAVHAGRLRAKEALRQSEERLRAVVENTPDVAIQWYDREGRLLFFNRASERILGLNRDSLGKTLLELGFWHASEEARFALVRAAAHAGEAVDPLEFSFRRPVGGDGVLFSTVFRIPYSAGGDCTVCMDVELTERRRLELQLNQAQRLTALGTLAGGIAHDFNNILVAVQGNVDLALEHLDDQHAAVRCLGEVQKASARAADLVRQILTFSRKREPKREVLDLASVVGEVLGLLGASLLKHVNVHTQVPSVTPSVFADSTQVHQVLVNLITNARHALGDEGGSITVGLDTLHVAEGTQPIRGVDLAPGEYVAMTVADDGQGMDEATLQRVFEPFFTTKGEGTGLGLSVVYGIMKAHEGAVHVTSRVGRGTTFTLYFPVAQRDRAALAKPAPGGLRIMLVDDEEVLVFIAQRMLADRGYRVTAFASPVLALQAFRAEPEAFDVLVTDASMPGMTGPQLIAHCRALDPSLRVVLASGYFRPEDTEAAERLGNVHLITKPSTVESYVKLIDRACARPGTGSGPGTGATRRPAGTEVTS